MEAEKTAVTPVTPVTPSQADISILSNSTADLSMSALTPTRPVTTPLDSTFPVFIPELPELFLTDAEFDAHLEAVVAGAELPEDVQTSKTELPEDVRTSRAEQPENRLVAALAKSSHAVHTAATIQQVVPGATLTDNGDVAFLDAGSPLLQLSQALTGTPTKKMDQMLADGWKADPDITLRLIMMARSIHLGKSEHFAAYHAFGWLYRFHPLTLIRNLRWIVAPVIPRSKGKATAGQDEERLGVRNAVSHGYWKDLVNLLVLASRGGFDITKKKQPVGLRQLLYHPKSGVTMVAHTKDEQREHRRLVREAAHANTVDRLESSPVFRALFAAVARLFASQLKTDVDSLTADPKTTNLSLAAKWAPTSHQFHDVYTTVTSAIAEILYPVDELTGAEPAASREHRLRLSRELYRRKVVSPLRRCLVIVERQLCAREFNKIHYDRLPSLALERYIKTFHRHDKTRFRNFVLQAASGTKAISGAILTPGQLVLKARNVLSSCSRQVGGRKGKPTGSPPWVLREMVQGQWKTLVEKVRQSGSLSSAIPVCDVSGSMLWKTAADGTTPLDHAIGMSLLISQVTTGPFHGRIITFSREPTFMTVAGPNDKRDFVDRVQQVMSAPFGMNTNFESVFSKLILPVAVEAKVSAEEMVKNVFVFSDMQFDQAQTSEPGLYLWTTSYVRVRYRYKKAGYDVPRLVFWNLAGSDGFPVQATDEGTAMVSGQSQGMLKLFLETGGFDGDVEVVEEDEDWEKVEKTKPKTETKPETKPEKPKMTPLDLVKKMVGHPAFGMLCVYD